MNLLTFGLLLINICFLVGGQTLWKIGLNNSDFTLSFMGILKFVFSPYIFAGLVIYVIATALWLYILSVSEFSIAYPLQSLCYIVAAFIAIFVFKENVPVTRWLGLALISAGAFLVSLPTK